MRTKNTLECFEYDGEFFDVEFTDNGYVEKVWMYVNGAFAIDLLDTTKLMTEWFRSKAEERHRDNCEAAEEKEYRKDDDSFNGDGAA